MDSALSRAVVAGRDAVRRNARPFLLIQAFAIGMASAYFLLPGAESAMTGVGDFKRQGGLPFAAITTVLASVALPELARALTGRRRTRASDLAFQILFFALVGVVVDLFYAALGTLFGHGLDPATIAKKLLVDQLAFSPFVATPLAITAFLWKEVGFSPARTIESFREHGGFRLRFLRTLIPNWCFWTPILFAVYAMPRELQFVLFLFAQAAWSLLLVDLNDEKASYESADL